LYKIKILAKKRKFLRFHKLF